MNTFFDVFFDVIFTLFIIAISFWSIAVTCCSICDLLNDKIKSRSDFWLNVFPVINILPPAISVITQIVSEYRAIPKQKPVAISVPETIKKEIEPEPKRLISPELKKAIQREVEILEDNFPEWGDPPKTFGQMLVNARYLNNITRSK